MCTVVEYRSTRRRRIVVLSENAKPSEHETNGTPKFFITRSDVDTRVSVSVRRNPQGLIQRPSKKTPYTAPYRVLL